MQNPLDPEIDTTPQPSLNPDSEDFAAMLESSLAAPPEKELRPGDKVRGKIVLINAEEAFVDFGGRSEGALAVSEIRDDSGAVKHAVGDTIEAIVASVDGTITLALSLRGDKANTDAVRQAFETGLPVEGQVKSVNTGGFEVRVGGVRAFCPFSQMDLQPVGDGLSWLQRTLPFKVTEFAENGRKVVLSRRALLEGQRRQQASGLRESLKVGLELDGTVTRLAPFGAFVELGGLEGLIHVSQLSSSRVKEVSEVVRPGQKVHVQVVKLEKVGEKDERVSLSMKSLQDSPWSSIQDKIHEGDTLQGEVVRLADFGAFVEVLPGLDGMVHVSQISRRRVAHPRDVLTVGQTVAVKVLKVDSVAKRLSLSIREAEGIPEGVELAAVGQILEGIVAGIKPYGLFVDLPSGQTGLLPRPEMDVPRNGDLDKLFKEGDTLQVSVLGVEADGKIRLSSKSAKEAEEAGHAREYMSRPAQASRSPQPARASAPARSAPPARNSAPAQAPQAPAAPQFSAFAEAMRRAEESRKGRS